MNAPVSMSENPFMGKWRVVSVYANVIEQGWTLFKRYGRESFVWEFCEIGSGRFPVGSVFRSGVLKESRLKHEPETTEFTYCTADWLLYIDRSDYEPDGFVNICIKWSTFAGTNTGCMISKMSKMSRRTTSSG